MAVHGSRRGGGLATVHIVGSRGDMQYMDITSGTAKTSKAGTRVTIGLITDEALAAFDQPAELQAQLLTEFALHLDRFRDFKILFLGDAIHPETVIEMKETLPLSLPEHIEGTATLTVIEWLLTDVERRLYLCSTHGSIVDEPPPGVQAPGAEFTAYLQWDGFAVGDPMTLESETHTPAGQVIQAAREALREHLAKSARRREAETVRRWRSEGVYPYAGEPEDAVESATRDVFNIVAMAAARTLEETRSRSVKALSLSLMKTTLESNPEALLPILHQVAKLPAARIDELREILEHTSLAQLIQTGKEVGGRVDFLNGLDSILFDRQNRKRLLERRQLHRILVHETWLFGEEWYLTGDDEPLEAVLKKFLTKLGHNVELMTERPVLRDNGSIAIPDMVLGRSLETNEAHTTHLVVELKRPSHKLTPADVDQLRSYASAIVNDERFARPNVTWDFWLVGNGTTREVDEMREQTHLPHGVVHSSKSYKITVRTWSEIIGAARHRLKFVQQSLQYESTRDTGLAYLRSRYAYAEYLPVETLAEGDPVPGPTR
jgi:hypothetical protein